MLVRALIVLLIVLNLGVAAWWIARPAPAPVVEPAPPLGVARLKLVDETRGAASPAAGSVVALPNAAPASVVSNAPAATPSTPETAPVSAAKPTADAPVAPPPPEPAKPTPPAATAAAAPPLPVPEPPAKAQCFSVGPFADAAAADAARAKLQPLAQKLASRSEGGGSKSARGWRVYLPTANADAAQATAQRIRAAGFNDLFVMSGAEANAIALGRFRGEGSARKRGAELSAAGFAVRVEALGETAGGATWIDVATTTSNGDDLRRAAGASRWRGRSCAGLG
ncbi:SPOR domain-containing protein [Lysobacter sp. CA199]|uniref:SPOR domain-containing protein n=1 Tax=Lysobacter sp. CA199 TaxID=3455608 RepID=UPI003F8D8AEA